MLKKIFLFMVTVVLLGNAIVMAHPGRTDKKGCHKEKQTKTRHCH
jgi:hypothetical protein